MNILLFTKPKAAITLLVALIFIVNPELLLIIMGGILDPAGEMMTRILGGAYFASGLSLWSISTNKDISAKNAHFYAIGEFISGAALAFGAYQLELNALAWILIASYILFTGGFFMVANTVSQTPESQSYE